MVGTTDNDFEVTSSERNSSTSCVRPSVVVLKNFPAEVHCGQHVWCQNRLISESNGAKVAGDMHQLSF
jgi:hypothetical protein